MDKWLEMLKTLAPIIMTTAKVPPSVIGVTIAAMSTAEQIHDGGTGPSKLAFVQGIGNQAIDSILSIKPGLFDGGQAKTALVEGVNTAVAIANAVHKTVVTN